MNYVNYETSIVEMYHVKLVGWPENIPFGNPSTIPDVGAVRRLRKALTEKTCHWIKMTERQQQEHDEMLQEKRSAGQVVGVKRKQRSDKGGIHKKWGRHRRKGAVEDEPESANQEGNQDEQDDAEEDVVRKPRRSTRSKAKSATSQVPPVFKSREFVGDDDESADGGEDSDYNDDDD